MGPFKRFRFPKLFPAGPNSTFETRRFQRSLAVGVVLTLLACAADQLGLLQSLDDWFYDMRAAHCQVFASKPDDRIVHLDIDDASLDATAVGRWPWPRRKLARIVDEIGRAKPAAIALDLLLTEPEKADDTPNNGPAGPPSTSDDDALLAQAMHTQQTTVLATMFHLLGPENETAEQLAATAELRNNLELTADELLEKLRSRGKAFSTLFDVGDIYAHARSVAMRSRVTEELSKASLTDEQLIARLLPHTDLAVQSPATKILKQEAESYRNRLAFRRFGLPITEGMLAPVAGEFDRMPITEFTQNTSYCGFVNFDIFPSGTIREIPLLVQAEGRLYPQLGLALGCAVMGTDVRKIRVENDRVIVPRPAGGELIIPTHSFHSKSLDRNCSSICDIPYFGGSKWETMYDWPNHLQKVNHLSMNVVWDICTTQDKIKLNNRTIDKAVQIVLGGDGDFAVDPAAAERYFKSLPAEDDSQARENIAGETLRKLADSHFLEDFLKIPEKERSQKEQKQTELLQSSATSLQTLVAVNSELRKQLESQRSSLARRLGGKGVLVGWTAEGVMDRINTSLTARCPGVVIHGVIAESVLSGRWWRRSPNWLGVVLMFFLGVAATIFVARLQPLRGFLASLLLVVVYLLINGYVLFDASNWIVPVAGPVVAISVVWSGCTLQRVISESIERNRVATEVAIINREMDLAHQVQAALIPKRPPAVPGLEAEGWTLPASTTGGDCYDLWQLSDGRLAILVADASGHGLAPAMIVSQVRTLVRAMSDLELHPHDLLRRINLRVAEDLEAGRFITVFLGFLSPDGLLDYASAGHGPQFWYDCDGCDLQLLDSTGAPLGCDTEWLCDDPLPPIQIAPGGTLAVFSDGIFEAVDPKGELFGIDRLKEILHTHRGQPGKTIIGLVTNAMLQWQKTPHPVDDQTVVIARRVATTPSA